MLWNIDWHCPHNVVVGQTRPVRLVLCAKNTDKLRYFGAGIVKHNKNMIHLPCPLYGLSWRELRPVPMDVFLNFARDGRLVVISFFIE